MQVAEIVSWGKRYDTIRLTENCQYII